MPNAQNAKNKRKERTTIFNCLTLKKSSTPSASDSILYLRRAYEDFCRETTIHGLKHTVTKNFHWFERLLWFLLTNLAFYGAVYCAVSQFTRYSSEPIVVSLQRDYTRWWTTFPALTVCFIDRVQPDVARKTIEDLWNVTEDSDPEKYQYYYGFIELVSDVSFRSNLQNFWKYQTDDSVRNIDLRQLAVTVHPNYTINVMKSQNHDKLKWMPVMTEDGLCMSYNSRYAEHQFALDHTKWEGDRLLQCHYHSGKCFVKVACSGPARFFIHSPFDISTAISNPTGEVSADEELVMDFKAIEIQAATSVRTLRMEQRRCQYPDERLSDSIPAYSFGLCQMLCRTRMALMFCGCRPYFFVKGDGDTCDAHGMACIGRNVEILINLPQNLAKCSCLPQCTELNYYSHTKKIVVR